MRSERWASELPRRELVDLLATDHHRANPPLSLVERLHLATAFKLHETCSSVSDVCSATFVTQKSRPFNGGRVDGSRDKIDFQALAPSSSSVSAHFSISLERSMVSAPTKLPTQPGFIMLSPEEREVSSPNSFCFPLLADSRFLRRSGRQMVEG